MHNKKTGFTIIELLISLLLLTIVFIAGMAFYFYSNQFMLTSFHRRVATELANSIMEQIKQDGYDSLPNPAPTSGLWQGPIPINIEDLTGNQNIYVTDIDDDGDNATDYKQVNVEIDWQEPGKKNQQTIKLETYIAP